MLPIRDFSQGKGLRVLEGVEDLPLGERREGRHYLEDTYIYSDLFSLLERGPFTKNSADLQVFILFRLCFYSSMMF